MHVIVTGVRHKMASIEVRERFALLENEFEEATRLLLSLPGIHGCSLLSTCNRSEMYLVVDDVQTAYDSVCQFYRTLKNIDINDYRSHMFQLLNEDAALHLFRVASGLDSLILGEGQILGQVKDMLSAAQRRQSIHPVLDRLLKAAIMVGKRVRTETGIADKDISVSKAAYTFSKQYFKKQNVTLFDQKIALIGGGKMASLLMSSLSREMTPEQKANVCIVNRSEERLAELTEQFGFQGKLWSDLSQVIEEADVLFVATGAPHVLLGSKHFEHLNSEQPKLLIDISMPRNVDPSVGELSQIDLYNTDNLSGVIDLSKDSQQDLVAMASRIIDEELDIFTQWRVSRSASPTISFLHAKLEALRQKELEKQGIDSDEVFALADNLSRMLVKKILHEPSVKLREGESIAAIHAQADLLSQLFNITESSTEISAKNQSVGDLA